MRRIKTLLTLVAGLTVLSIGIQAYAQTQKAVATKSRRTL